jgi:hypothetical protein
LLDRTRAVLIEIHHAADLPLITAVLQEAGLALGGVRGINYFYRRPAGHQPTRRQALRA